MSTADCDFCRIASGAGDAVEVVCEGHDWVAFFPLAPATPGHTLVIPRTHVIDLWEADTELASHLINAAIRVGRAVKTALCPDGMNLITSSGPAAEQTVFHLHLHVVPRWENDGFGRIWPTERRYENAVLVNVAKLVRSACSFSNEPSIDRR